MPDQDKPLTGEALQTLRKEIEHDTALRRQEENGRRYNPAEYARNAKPPDKGKVR